MRYLATNPVRLALLAALLASLVTATEPDAEYRWRILPNIGTDTVNLTLTWQVGQNTSSHTNSVPLGSLRGLERSDMLGGPASFRLRRDAGTLYCKGSFTLLVGWGTVNFQPDPNFLSELKEIGLGDVDESKLFELAIEDFRVSTARDLRAACNNCVKTLDDVIQLRDHGVDARYLRQLAQLSADPPMIEDITQMKDHGVQIPLLEALRFGGYHLQTDSIIQLQDHGVDASFIREMSSLSKDARDAHDLIALHDAGVSADFVHRLRESGINPSVNEVIQLHDHGTDPALVKAVMDTHLDNSVSSTIALQDHGVDSQYVRALSEALHGKVTASELIQLHDHGVSSDFAKRVEESGFQSSGSGQLISLQEHGVPAELLAQAAHSHRANFDTDEIVRLHDEGIDAQYLRSFDEAGYVNISAAELKELHDHGITADFARRMQSKGFGVLSVSQLVEMKDHGM